MAAGRPHPTERELMQQYSCARMTVHRAISDLVDRPDPAPEEGRVLRGAAHVQTAVLESQTSPPWSLRAGDLPVRIAGSRAARRWRLPEAVDLLDLNGDVLVLDGLHIADGLPFAWNTG